MSHPILGHSYGENEIKQEFKQKKQSVAKKMDKHNAYDHYQGLISSDSLKRFEKFGKSKPSKSKKLPF